MNIFKRIGSFFRNSYAVSAPKNLKECVLRSLAALFTVLSMWVVIFNYSSRGFCFVLSKNLWLLTMLIPVVSAPFIQYYTRNDSK